MRIKNFEIVLIGFFFALGLDSPLNAQVGLMPIPVLQDIKVQSQITLDQTTGLYTYAYTFTNSANSSGEIRRIEIDITQPSNGQSLSSDGLTIPIGLQNIPFVQEIGRESFFRLNPAPMVPVGMHVPAGWNGGIGVGGYASFGSNGSAFIFPGETRGGFELISRGLPAIRECKVIPKWVFLVESEETVTPSEIQAAIDVEEKIKYSTKILGPTAPPRFLDFKAFLDTIRSYIDQSVALAWLPDPTLTNTLRTELNTAGSFLDANDPTSAKMTLQHFMETIDQATLAQRAVEAQALLFFNAKHLKDTLPDTYIPPVLRLDLSPQEIALPIGSVHALTATFTEDNSPSPGYRIILEITSGPNKGITLWEFSDVNGKAVFYYISELMGTDVLVARIMGEGGEVIVSTPVRVTWSGGPDLVIELFIPPIIKIKEGENLIEITEITGNHGNTAAESSVTRYYISPDPIIEPNNDQPIGERIVPPLNAAAISKESTKVLLPDDLQTGTYYLGACADADDMFLELNEQNNCEVNQLVIALDPFQNQPPDCTQAKPNIDILWPPNHKLVPISILGVNDVDGDSITITITKITQDEPVNGLGDGDTSPDGLGIGTSEAKVRGERSGKGGGRVYDISFTATDGKGGSCTGQVKAGVPHDKGKGNIPIDGGQRYDSTLL